MITLVYNVVPHIVQVVRLVSKLNHTNNHLPVHHRHAHRKHTLFSDLYIPKNRGNTIKDGQKGKRK